MRSSLCLHPRPHRRHPRPHRRHPRPHRRHPRPHRRHPRPHRRHPRACPEDLQSAPHPRRALVDPRHKGEDDGARRRRGCDWRRASRKSGHRFSVRKRSSLRLHPHPHRRHPHPHVVILGLVPRIYSRRRIPGGRWWILATRARMTERDEGATGGALPGKADTGFPSGSAPASAVILAPTVVTVTPTVVTVTLTAVILTPTVILGLVPRIYSRRRIPGGRWWILATRARMTERGEDAGKDKDIERVRAVQRGRALGPIRAALDLAPSGRTEERPFH